jgi:cytochrome P450
LLGDREPTAEDAKALVYCERVLLEGLRLYPSAWAVGREAVNEVELKGRRYPKGTQLMSCQWAMQRDANVFPDPLRFDPDRWTPEMRRSLPRGAYFPFADGPRVCIGNHFAMLEAQIILVSMIRRVSLTLVPGQELALAPSVTLRAARGIRMRVARG